MRFCDWFNLKPGMKIARNIFSNDCLLLAQGTTLTASIIQRLPIWGIQHVLVEVLGSQKSG